MSTLKRLLLPCVALLIGVCASAQRRGLAADAVFEYPDAHDPVAAFCDGRYYVFTTGMTVMSSDDLIHWKFEEPVFREPPGWAAAKGFRRTPWAPDILYHDGMYYLYYSYSMFGRNTSAIGVTTNKTLNPASPDFKWEDQGMIVESVPGRDEWNAIDANVIIDGEGTGWLVFGSFWRGIRMCRLDSTLTRLSEPQEWYPVCRRPEGTVKDIAGKDDGIERDSRGTDFDPGNGAVEAPFIFRHGDWYYLFVSYDLCCRGASSTYNVVVGRSQKVTGPYVDRDGVLLMEGGGTRVAGGNGRYSGMGHCAIVDFGGQDYIFMHGYDSEHEYRSKLLVKKLSWDDGDWPVVLFD